MGTVAVLAFSSFGKSQPGSFSVDSLKISLCNLLMAFAAGIHDLKLESALICPFDGVRRMAIIARR